MKKRNKIILGLVTVITLVVTFTTTAFATDYSPNPKHNIINPFPLKYLYFLTENGYQGEYRCDTYSLHNQFDVGSPTAFFNGLDDIITGEEYAFTVARSYGNLLDDGNYQEYLQPLADNFLAEHIYQCSYVKHSDHNNANLNIRIGLEPGYYTNLDYLTYMPSLWLYSNENISNIEYGMLQYSILVPIDESDRIGVHLIEGELSIDCGNYGQWGEEEWLYYSAVGQQLVDYCIDYLAENNLTIEEDLPIYAAQLEYVPSSAYGNNDNNDHLGVGISYFGVYGYSSLYTDPIDHIHRFPLRSYVDTETSLLPIGSAVATGVDGFLSAEVLPRFRFRYIIGAFAAVLFVVALIRRLGK